MVSIARFDGIRAARREAAVILEDAVVNDWGKTSVHLLRKDGDTEVFTAQRKYGKYEIRKRKVAGWLTGGLRVDPCDCPCLIW